MVLGGLSTGIEVDGGIVVVEMGSLLWCGFRVMNACWKFRTTTGMRISLRFGGMGAS